ncbi:MAG: DNA mismatch repair endonuclease MutL [Lachnospiraceae bacterium]|nr:DNA mismatch repair endonuclease MutL [Lachnospiraceae bacterium]
MGKIFVLDNITIDKIAAGEVVERPASVVKELVENAMDSGASAITVEIKNGGIEFIRVTDNGKGIEKEDIPKAFLRHATSKIRQIEDLDTVLSMGFRGEALASIASVAKVELITKCHDELMGNRYVIEGGVKKELEEIGAPSGTTIIVRNLFYNTPARRKFLKSESAEGGHIADILEHLALCRPDIAFSFIMNGKTKFSTAGNNDLKEVIYRIFGRETAKEMIPVSYEKDGIKMEGYLGTPVNNRPNRNYENYFINKRFVKSDIIAKGIEEGYKAYLMQHKFPFCVLNFEMDTHNLDVNVHPAKMEVRFHNKQDFYDFLSGAVRETLQAKEMISDCVVSEPVKEKFHFDSSPQPFETNRRISEDLPAQNFTAEISDKKDAIINAPKEEHAENNIGDTDTSDNDFFVAKVLDSLSLGKENADIHKNVIKEKEHIFVEKDYVISQKPVQLSLFEEEERVLSEKARKNFTLIGQIFESYWLLTYGENLYFIDQHAAHEKVNYEKLMKRYRDNAVVSQQINPPIIVSLSPKEGIWLKDNLTYFLNLGFELEAFGGNEYALRAIPLELYQNDPKDMFLSALNELVEAVPDKAPDVITDRIATMACKASVKAGKTLSRAEMEELLDELLKLENPYHCPHGRPTLFSMSKYEIEKKFKRII